MLLSLIAQATDSYPISTDYGPSAAGAQAATAGASVFGFFYFALVVLMIVTMWRIFTKAGRPGWHCLIPIYSTVVLLRIVGKPGWWFLLIFVPLVNIIIVLIMHDALSKSFGKSTAFTLGLIFVPFITLPILAFGGAKYIGPGGMPMTLTVPMAPQV
ncbi:MAG: DUF5684 domain-containing protein [Candidatus Roizmanbacteria bacterium]